MTDGAGLLTAPGVRLPQTTDEARWPIRGLATAIVCTLAAALAALLAPGVRPILLQEDGIVEMATALALSAAMAGAALALVRRGPRLPLLVAGAVGTTELMDETSFGARIFGFRPPALYGGGELDGFHDLLILAYRLLDGVSHLLAWSLAGLILAGSLASLLLALRAVADPARRSVSRLSSHALILLHFGFIGLAQAIDVTASDAMLSAAEEVMELDAALMLALYVMQQARGGGVYRRPTPRSYSWMQRSSPGPGRHGG